MEPILKWAGGKRRLLKELKQRLPDLVKKNEKFDYCEPFFGGGALLFEVISKFNTDKVLINDINSRLVNFYVQTKKKPDALVNEIQSLIVSFNKIRNKKECYYDVRSEFNKTSDHIQEASMLYFLNKSCFNGIYRENKNGQFNVPFGNKESISVDSDNIFSVSHYFNKANVEIRNSSFDEIILTTAQTFYFLDPPYRPISNTSSFTSYSHKSDDNDLLQIKLAAYCKEIDSIGSMFMQTNSLSTDGYFQNLYSKFSIDQIKVMRGLAANKASRKKVGEIIITNYAGNDISASK